MSHQPSSPARTSALAIPRRPVAAPILSTPSAIAATVASVSGMGSARPRANAPAYRNGRLRVGAGHCSVSAKIRIVRPSARTFRA